MKAGGGGAGSKTTGGGAGGGQCCKVTALTKAECAKPENKKPANSKTVNCKVAKTGTVCEGEGECGTNNNLNNCGAYDLYHKAAPCGGAAGKTTGKAAGKSSAGGSKGVRFAGYWKQGTTIFWIHRVGATLTFTWKVSAGETSGELSQKGGYWIVVLKFTSGSKKEYGTLRFKYTTGKLSWEFQAAGSKTWSKAVVSISISKSAALTAMKAGGGGGAGSKTTGGGAGGGQCCKV